MWSLRTAALKPMASATRVRGHRGFGGFGGCEPAGRGGSATFVDEGACPMPPGIGRDLHALLVCPGRGHESSGLRDMIEP